MQPKLSVVPANKKQNEIDISIALVEKLMREYHSRNETKKYDTMPKHLFRIK